MWAWLIAAYATLFLMVTGAAAAVALFVDDAARRDMAYKVFKLVLGAGTGAGGFAALIIKLQLGLP